MNEILRDRIALVTGGARPGTGYLWSVWQREGCHVAVADLYEAGAIQTAEGLPQLPRGAPLPSRSM